MNSTVSGNHAISNGNYDGGGGGIINIGDPEQGSSLYRDRPEYRDRQYGGHLRGRDRRRYATMVVVGSIVSGNSGNGFGNEVGIGPGGSITYSGFNVLGHSGETTAEAFYSYTPYASTIVATSDGALPTALDAILDTTLAGNGGPTDTHALVADSPAVDHVPDYVCEPGNAGRRPGRRPAR